MFELGRKPGEVTRYATKPIYLAPREVDPHDLLTAPSIIVYLEKWPSGYRIGGGPVTTDFDNAIFVHRGQAEYADIPQGIYGEAVRQLALKMLAEADRKKREGGAIDTEAFFEQVQRVKGLSRIDIEIAQIEANLLKGAKDTALGVVTVEEFGTYYKLPSGNWRGPGGNYGPETVLGRKLEEGLKRHQNQGGAK